MIGDARIGRPAAMARRMRLDLWRWIVAGVLFIAALALLAAGRRRRPELASVESWPEEAAPDADSEASASRPRG